MDFSVARTNMVQSQIVPHAIDDESLLDAFFNVPREMFLTETQRTLAYSDVAIPLNKERRLLTPIQTARMIDALQVTPGDKVLVVGANVGYEAALLSEMGITTYALETDNALAKSGKKQTQNIEWKIGPMISGWDEKGPFDGILICGAIPELPSELIGQLHKNGRLITILGRSDQIVMRLVRVHGVAGGDHPETLYDTHATPLTGFETLERFQL
ncbi:protein-L-isoaspartate O-methyltransferase family protein [Magnetococcales bacterium HHB-1]